METNRDKCFEAITTELARAGKSEPVDLLPTWDACSCALMPTGFDLFLLDTASIVGPPAAMRWLNLALALPEDTFPSVAISNLKKIPVRMLILEMEFYRKRWMKMQPGWIEHHTRWINRLLRIKKVAVKMLNWELEHAAS